MSLDLLLIKARYSLVISCNKLLSNLFTNCLILFVIRHTLDKVDNKADDKYKPTDGVLIILL